VREHTTTARVRYGETDQMGVAYHGSYLPWFEMGRTELMRAAGLAYAELERRGYLLVVTEAHLEFRSSAAYDEVLTIRTRVAEIGKASVRFDYTIAGAGGEVRCEGYTRLACLSREGRRLARLPEDIVGRLAAP
jgi:acyl-CoA thioester hydrolase